MARQRISLVSDEVKKEIALEAKIRSGEINADNFYQLSPSEQVAVNKLLFKISSEKVEPNVGASVLEFILFGFIRIMNKKVQGLPLTLEEKEIEESLNTIFNMHDITNESIAKEDWLFDYMSYATVNANKILQTRKEHISRKKKVTGKPE